IGTSGNFTLRFDNLDDVPGATGAQVVLMDNVGNASAATVVDFSTSEAGGPIIAKARIKGTKLKLTGTNFATSMQVEVNGQAIALPAGSTVSASGNKSKIELSNLPFHTGTNRFRLL